MEYLTANEVAEICKVNIGSVWRWIRQGKLKARKLGNRYRVERGELYEFMKGA